MDFAAFSDGHNHGQFGHLAAGFRNITDSNLELKKVYSHRQKVCYTYGQKSISNTTRDICKHSDYNYFWGHLWCPNSIVTYGILSSYFYF